MQELRKLTLDAVFEHAVAAYADRPSLGNVGEEHMTYGEFGERVRAAAEQLREVGVIAGDRVAILSENKPNWGVAYFAIASIGAVSVPILPDFHESAIHHILRHSEAKAIYVSDKLSEKVAGAAIETPPVIFSMEDFSLREDLIDIEYFEKAGRTFRGEFRKFREQMKERALKYAGREREKISEDDLACIIYTSGTTGHSKGVMLSHRSIVYDAIYTGQLVHVNSEDNLLSILPLAHTYECTLGLVIPVFLGCKVSYISKPPTPRNLVAALATVKPTIVLSVPLVIEKIFKKNILPKFTKSRLMRLLYSIQPVRKMLHQVAGKKLMETFGGRLRCFCIGGAPLSPEVEKFLRHAKFPYSLGYGMTETAPMVSGVGPADCRYRAAGKVIKGVEVMIDDPNPATGEGEILVRGPIVMKGYYKAPQLTEEVLTPDGWLRTGDLGIVKRGFIYIKGRLKNVILGPSGENIYPEEIEAILNEFESVNESLVYEYKDSIIARVHLDYDKLDDEINGSATETKVRERVQQLLGDLRAKVNARTPRYVTIQRVVEQTEPFEKTPTQKIKRFLYLNEG